MKVRSKTLDNELRISPPDELYHYTSPKGLIGILQSKEIWATNIRFLNDFNELVEASNIAKKILKERISSSGKKHIISLLEKMLDKVGSAASRYYVCSFSEDNDSLPQWRAYCPPTGGYALGIPSMQLSALAKEHKWYFVRCVYNDKRKNKIIEEIITSFVNEFNLSLKNEDYKKKDFTNIEEFELNIALNFQMYVAKIGGAIKHTAFESEREWRLISPLIIETDENIEFREGSSGVIPYYRFELQTKINPNLTEYEGSGIKLIIGPTPQMNSEAQQAAQFILRRYLGIEKGHSLSKVPYRGW